MDININFFLPTISGIEEYLQPVEEAILHHLLPAITGGHVCNDSERLLLSLFHLDKAASALTDDITDIASFEHQNSIKMTHNLTKQIFRIAENTDAKISTSKGKRKNKEKSNEKRRR